MSVRVRPIFWHLLRAETPRWYETDEVRAHLRKSIEGIPPHFDGFVGPVRCTYPDDDDNWLLSADEIQGWYFAARLSGRKHAAD